METESARIRYDLNSIHGNIGRDWRRLIFACKKRRKKNEKKGQSLSLVESILLFIVLPPIPSCPLYNVPIHASLPSEPIALFCSARFLHRYFSSFIKIHVEMLFANVNKKDAA